jgi:GNAT superfamily N-acetyltransferase
MEEKRMISIEMAGRSDIQVVADFQVMMARETENLDLDPGTVMQGVTAVFDDPGKGFYLVARADEGIVACLMITREWSDWRNRTVWWIQSLYVVPGYRRRGIFRSMYAWLIDRIREDDRVGGIRLYVDRTNVKAQRVYEAIGMDGEHYRFYEDMK